MRCLAVASSSLEKSGNGMEALFIVLSGKGKVMCRWVLFRMAKAMPSWARYCEGKVTSRGATFGNGMVTSGCARYSNGKVRYCYVGHCEGTERQSIAKYRPNILKGGERNDERINDPRS